MISYGWVGKYIRVDLSKSLIQIESSKDLTKRFIGGKGIGQWLLFNHLSPNVNPLHPENLLIFSTGPLTGTMAPASCRTSIDTKNLLTGGVSSSNVGGHFGPELKFAGFDFLVFKGSCKDQVYLEIIDDQVTIKDASHLWGKSTWEAEEILQKDINEPNLRVASIGVAGENLAKAACIIADRGRAAGRGGCGAIMGSKKLKAIAVRGTGDVVVADPDRFMREVQEAWIKIDKNPSTELRRSYGTRGFLPNANNLGLLGVRNFQNDDWSQEKIEKIRQEILNEKYEIRKLACFNCPAYCSHYYKVDEGPYSGLICEGFQTNVDWDFAAKIDITDPLALMKINALCNELGLDIDNSSAPIAWAFELFEKGIIDTDETDGLKLEWGDSKVVIDLLKKIAKREGFGKILAEGSKRASEIIGKGSEKFVSHIKGQDSIEAIRADKGWALGCVTAPRGGGHLDGAFQTYRTPDAGDPHSYNLKAQKAVWFEKFKAVVDMMGICYFLTVWSHKDLLGPNDFAKLFNTATGLKMKSTDLMLVGERVHNIEKAFNTLHASFKRKDDFPPRRFMIEPISSGPHKGEKLDEKGWNHMLDEYYQIHSWDVTTGWQTSDGLDRVKLIEVKEKLDRYGKLINK